MYKTDNRLPGTYINLSFLPITAAGPEPIIIIYFYTLFYNINIVCMMKVACKPPLLNLGVVGSGLHTTS